MKIHLLIFSIFLTLHSYGRGLNKIATEIESSPTLTVQIGGCRIVNNVCFKTITMTVMGGSGKYLKGFRLQNSNSQVIWSAWDDYGIPGGFILAAGNYIFSIEDTQTKVVVEQSVNVKCEQSCFFNVTASQSVCRTQNGSCYQTIILSPNNGSGKYVKGVRTGNDSTNTTGIVWLPWSYGGVDGGFNLLSSNKYTIFVKDTISKQIATTFQNIYCPDSCVAKLYLTIEKDTCKNINGQCYQPVLLRIKGGTGLFQKGVRNGANLDINGGVVTWSNWADGAGAGAFNLLPGNYTFFVRDVNSQQSVADTATLVCLKKCIAPLTMLAQLQKCIKEKDICNAQVLLIANGATGKYLKGYKNGKDNTAIGVHWNSWESGMGAGLFYLPTNAYTFFVKDSITQEVVSYYFNQPCSVCNPSLQLTVNNTDCKRISQQCNAEIVLRANGGSGNYLKGYALGLDISTTSKNITWYPWDSVATGVFYLLPNSYTLFVKDQISGDIVAQSYTALCPNSCKLAVKLTRNTNYTYTSFGQNDLELIPMTISGGTPYYNGYEYYTANRLMSNAEISNFVSSNRTNSSYWIWKKTDTTSYVKLLHLPSNTITVVGIDSISFAADTASYYSVANCQNIGTPTFFNSQSKYMANYESATLAVRGCTCVIEFSAYDQNNNLIPSLFINGNTTVSNPYYASDANKAIFPNGGSHQIIKIPNGYSGNTITFQARCTDLNTKTFSSKAVYVLKVVKTLDDIGFAPCKDSSGTIDLRPSGSRGEYEFYVGNRNKIGEKIWWYYGQAPFGKVLYSIKEGQEIWYRTSDDQTNDVGDSFVIPSSVPACQNKSNYSSSFDNMLNEVDSATNFVVYPNPAKGSEVMVSFNSVSDAVYQLRLIDEQGRIYFTNQLIGTGETMQQFIKLGDFTNGQYLVTLSDGKQNNTRIIIKEN